MYCTCTGIMLHSPANSSKQIKLSFIHKYMYWKFSLDRIFAGLNFLVLAKVYSNYILLGGLDLCGYNFCRFLT